MPTLFPAMNPRSLLVATGALLAALSLARANGTSVDTAAAAAPAVLPIPAAAVPAAPAAASASGAATAPAADPLKTPPENIDGYLKLGFDRLGGYKFIAPPFDPAAASDPNAKPPASGEEQIPAVVKNWSGKKAIVTGYMMPTKMEKGLVTEFLLVKDPMMCCYGTVPNVNEWIIVRMKPGIQPLMDLPISFYGELKVGAMFDNNYLTGIYLLNGEKMGEVQN